MMLLYSIFCFITGYLCKYQEVKNIDINFSIYYSESVAFNLLKSTMWYFVLTKVINSSNAPMINLNRPVLLWEASLTDAHNYICAVYYTCLTSWMSTV